MKKHFFLKKHLGRFNANNLIFLLVNRFLLGLTSIVECNISLKNFTVLNVEIQKNKK
jgi:hypothetical protein